MVRNFTMMLKAVLVVLVMVSRLLLAHFHGKIFIFRSPHKFTPFRRFHPQVEFLNLKSKTLKEPTPWKKLAAELEALSASPTWFKQGFTDFIRIHSP